MRTYIPFFTTPVSETNKFVPNYHQALNLSDSHRIQQQPPGKTRHRDAHIIRITTRRERGRQPMPLAIPRAPGRDRHPARHADGARPVQKRVVGRDVVARARARVEFLRQRLRARARVRGRAQEERVERVRAPARQAAARLDDALRRARDPARGRGRAPG